MDAREELLRTLMQEAESLTEEELLRTVTFMRDRQRERENKAIFFSHICSTIIPGGDLSTSA